MARCVAASRVRYHLELGATRLKRGSVGRHAMITSSKIEFWLRHREHPDIVDRGNEAERAVLSTEEWTWLEETAAKLRLARAGLPGATLNEAMERELLADVEPVVVATLRSVAESK